MISGVKFQARIVDFFKLQQNSTIRNSTTRKCSMLQTGRLKTRDWKTRHQIAGVENAGVAQYGKPKSPLFNIVTSVLQQPLELM